MTQGSHRASVTIDAKVDAADKEIRKLTRRINRFEESVRKADAITRKQGTSIRRLKPAAQESSAGFEKLVRGLGTAGFAGAAGLATGVALELARASEELANRAIQTEAVFHNLPIAIEPARSATMGYVSDMDLATAASQAVSLGVEDSARGFGELSGALARLGLSRGLTALEGIESGIAAIGRGSTEMLDNLGITLKAAQAQQEYARQLGVSVSALTDEQRAAAFGVVAKQKVIEAAKGIEVTTDGAAAAVKRFHVELENLETRALGGERQTRNLASALVELNREQTVNLESLRLYGSETEALEGRLRDMGVAYTDLTGNVSEYIRILRFAQQEERRAARARQVELANAPFEDFGPELTPEIQQGIERQQNEARIRETKLEIASLEGLKKARGAVSDLMSEQAELLARNAELAGETGRAEDIRLNNEIRLLRESGKEAGRAHGKVKSLLERMVEVDKKRLDAFSEDEPDLSFLDSETIDPFSAENEHIGLAARAEQIEQERELEAVRRDGLLQDELADLELRRELGLDPIEAIDLEEQARLEHLDFLMTQSESEAQLLALQNQQRQIAHAAEMKRIRAERHAQEQRMSLYEDVSDLVVGTYRATAAAAIAASFSQGQSVREMVHSTAKAESMRATITAGAAAVQALFWALIPGGQLRAVKWAAVAAKAGVAAATFGGIAGSAANAGGAGQVSGGAGGGFANATTLGVGEGAPRALPAAPGPLPGADSQVPGSPVPPASTPPGPPPPPPTGSQQQSTGINFSGATVHLYGTPEDDFLQSVKRGVANLDLKRKT